MCFLSPFSFPLSLPHTHRTCILSYTKHVSSDSQKFVFNLTVQFFLKTDSIPGMWKILYSPWQTLEVPSTLTPIGQLHQSPPSPVPGYLSFFNKNSILKWSKSISKLKKHQARFARNKPLRFDRRPFKTGFAD